MKKVFIVGYGGGHINMLIPILRELNSESDFKPKLMALTTGGVKAKSLGLPFVGYKDYLHLIKKESVSLAQSFLQEHHNPLSGIDISESLAYFAANLEELIAKHGKERAIELFKDQGRQIFLPVKFFKKILEQEAPDVVVTTCSPKSEYASIVAARELGIPSLGIEDLFAISSIHQPEYDNVGLLSGISKDFLDKRGIKYNRAYIMGNPSFDVLNTIQKNQESSFLKDKFPNLSKNSKVITFFDQPGYMLNSTDMYIRSESDVYSDLEGIGSIAGNRKDFSFLIKPHPNQNREVYDRFFSEKKISNVFFCHSISAEELIVASDLICSFSSTTLAQAAILGKAILVLNLRGHNHFDMPLWEYGLAKEVQSWSEFEAALSGGWLDLISSQSLKEYFPVKESAIKVKSILNDIIASRRGYSLIDE